MEKRLASSLTQVSTQVEFRGFLLLFSFSWYPDGSLVAVEWL